MSGMSEEQNTAQRVADPTCQCGRRKTLWRYESAITNSAAGIEYGEIYGTLLCPWCDGMELWPGMGKYGRAEA